MAENVKRYRSALTYALNYAKDDKKLAEYQKLFEESGIKTESRVNLQNCMLFAGALLDENMGFDEKKTQQYSKCREDVQYDIVFNEDNSKMITKVMLDLTNLIHRIDKQKGYDNKKHYENVYLTSKQIVKDLHEEFEEALGERRKEFLDTVLGK